MREQCDISNVANPVTFLLWGDRVDPPVAMHMTNGYLRLGMHTIPASRIILLEWSDVRR